MKTEIAGPGYSSRTQRTFTLTGRVLDALHLDGPLLLTLIAVCAVRPRRALQRAGENMGVFFGAGRARRPRARRAWSRSRRSRRA